MFNFTKSASSLLLALVCSAFVGCSQPEQKQSSTEPRSSAGKAVAAAHGAVDAVAGHDAAVAEQSDMGDDELESEE